VIEGGKTTRLSMKSGRRRDVRPMENSQVGSFGQSLSQLGSRGSVVPSSLLDGPFPQPALPHPSKALVSPPHPSHPLNPGLFPDFCGKPLRWETSRGRTSAPSELMSRTQPRTGCVRPAVKTSAWASPCPGTEAEDNRGSLLAGSFPSVAIHWDGVIAGRARGEFRCGIHCPRYRSR